MKQLFIFVLFCCIQFPIWGQHSISLLDKTSQEPIPYASIYFPDYKTGVIADSNGNFIIGLQKSSILVQISAVGYKTFLETIKLGSTLKIYLEPSIHDFKEIIISDNSSRLQGENVLNVEKISLQNNTEMQGISLTEKLANVAGVSNVSTGVGIGKPVIRGLSGNRIAVFSQGVRIENQQWGDEHGLGLDENGYEEVEIIKGPASLLYGSDALGGVLYFSDERFANRNNVNAIINSEYNSNTNGWRNTGGFKLSKGKFHANVFGGYTTHTDYKDGNNDRVENSRFQTSDFKTSLGYVNDKLITSLKYSFLNEKYGLTENTQEPDYSYSNGRKPDYPYQDLTTHIISSENTFFGKNDSKVKVDIGYIFNSRKEYEEQTEDKQANLNMNLNTLSYNARWYSAKFKEKWDIIAGSQGMFQTNVNKGEEILVPDAVTADLGVFATSDYYYSEKSYWQIGLRFDGRHINSRAYGDEVYTNYIPAFDKTFTAFNFSTGIFQSLTKDLSLRANIASGFRAPNMFELLSNGVHEGTNRYEMGNSQLNTENSYQADVSLNYGNEHLEVFLNPYLNYIRNYIYLQPSDEIKENLPVYYYTQDDAYLYGGEAGVHFHPHPLDWLHIEASYSSTFGQNNNHNDLPLMPSQKINATLRVSFAGKKVIEKFSVYIHNLYSFEQNRIADYETSTKGYDLVNAGLQFDFKLNKQKLLLNLSVQNLFNEVYYDHLSRYKTEGIYNMGRNFNLKLSLPLQWKIKG